MTPAARLAELGELTAAQRICAIVGVSLESATGPSRRRLDVEARHRIVLLLRKRGMSSTEIGVVLGRDHSSILSALRKFDAGSPAPRASLQLLFLANARAAARAI